MPDWSRSTGAGLPPLTRLTGPTLGCAMTAHAALWAALEPYDNLIGELIATLPNGAVEHEVSGT